MKKFLLPENGNFYKAALHLHTNITDGDLTPEEFKKLYLDAGVSIVAYTDHDIFITHNDLTDNNFLALNGYELEIYEINQPTNLKITGKTCHICFIALSPDIKTPVCLHREKYQVGNAAKYAHLTHFPKDLPDYEREYSAECVCDIMQKGRENGFFVTYNHPTWSGESYPEYMNYNGMHALEIFNYESFITGNEDYNPRVYDDMLRGGKKIFCTAGDDAHGPVTIAGGITVIKADKLEYNCIANALKNGNFYATSGPEIKELYIEDDNVYVKTSPAYTISITAGLRRTAVRRANLNSNVTEAVFKVFPYDKHFRITVTDWNGKKANSNAYFLEDIK